MNRLRDYWDSRSPAARLTVAYVIIIMALSLVFTGALYRLSSQQLEVSLRREYLRFQPLFSIAPDDDSLAPGWADYQTELDRGRQHLLLELGYFNAVILVLASIASYQLARRTLRPIEQALELQTRFAGDASHELRTPLTAMQSEIEVALRNPKLDAKASRQLLASNLEEVAKLRGLSEGLLRLARQPADLKVQPVSLEEVVRQAVDRLAKSAAAKDIAIHRSGGDVTAMGDAQTLVELAAVLLDNAIKYSPPGSSVNIELARQSRQAVLGFRDHGVGIAAADQPHIFERFYRAENSRSKDKDDGYGLGLSIAQQIVQAHHGSIEVASRPGEGAVFTVRLPLAVKSRG